MSQYVNFFIRNKNDFISIGDFSRSSIIYKLFSYDLPWEKIKAISESQLVDYRSDIKNAITETEKSIAENKEMIEKISTFNNDASEKIELINDYKTYINDEQICINEYTYAKHFLSFLSDMIENNYESEHPCIYAGIEIGYPTVNDIIEGKK